MENNKPGDERRNLQQKVNKINDNVIMKDAMLNDGNDPNHKQNQ